jgi:hypothetical protein
MFHENAGKEESKVPVSSSVLSAPSINLPKCDGVIYGISEKAAANPVIGTGPNAVTIATCAGRSGFGTQYPLSYDFGSGKGDFEVNRNFSHPSISSNTDMGLHMYDIVDESDMKMEKR